MGWLDRLLKRRLFKPLEERVLQALEERLSAEASRLLAEQVRRINLVQRHSKGREVCLYAMRHGRPERDETLRFPATQRELKLATVHFEIPREGRFTAEVFLVDGHLFSIEFMPSPSAVMDRHDEVIVTRVNVHHDPMTPPAVGSGEARGTPAPTGWIGEPALAEQISDLKPPLAEVERTERVSTIEARLPDEYLETAAGTDGFRLGHAKVLGLGEVYSVVLDEATYYVLVQVGDSGTIGVRKHSHDGTLYFLSFDGGAQPRGGSFRDAVLTSSGVQAARP